MRSFPHPRIFWPQRLTLGLLLCAAGNVQPVAGQPDRWCLACEGAEHVLLPGGSCPGIADFGGEPLRIRVDAIDGALLLRSGSSTSSLIWPVGDEGR